MIDDLVKKIADLRGDYVRRRMEFIHTELNVALAMVRLAQTERELGNHARADRQLVLAQLACDEANRRIEECKREEWPVAFDSAKSKLAELLRLILDFRQGEENEV